MQALIAVMGVLVTLIVVAGVLLMTPGNTVTGGIDPSRDPLEPREVA